MIAIRKKGNLDVASIERGDETQFRGKSKGSRLALSGARGKGNAEFGANSVFELREGRSVA